MIADKSIYLTRAVTSFHYSFQLVIAMPLHNCILILRENTYIFEEVPFLIQFLLSKD
jgi:hypothetical protein